MTKSKTRVFFIINPAAGKGRAEKYAAWIRKEAEKRWKLFDIEIIREDQSVVKLALQKSKNFDLIVACGGDGTVNRVVNGIAKTDAKLGILPIGSGNDFIKTLALPDSLSECMDLLFRGHISAIDLIRYQGDAEGWCVNTLGIGLDGWANYYAHFYKGIPVNLKYILGVLRAYLAFRGASIGVRVDGKDISNNYLMLTACNGKWEGGFFKLAPKASLIDGSIDLLTIRKLPLLRILSYLPRLKSGLSSDMKGIQYYNCTELEISSKDGIAVHVDGEHLGRTIRQLNISIAKNGLEVITPQQKRKPDIRPDGTSQTG